ncbi:MAG: carboxylating nicotinate-nucleotide diphosphorylase [Planctomycetota bacterium]
MDVTDLNALPLPQLFTQLTADGSLDRLLEAARREDLADVGDVTTASMIEGGWEVRAAGVAREAGIVCGLPAVPRILAAFDCTATMEPRATDGEPCGDGDVLFRLRGELGPMLTAERTMLNILGRLGGIATLTRRYVDAVDGTTAAICDTRKTTPGLRFGEKYAVRCGGGTVHRLGLYDAVLFKDNHLAQLGPTELAPAVRRAVQAARARYDLRFVEVEVDDLQQLRALLQCEAGLIDIVLLDNMPVSRLREAISMRDAQAPQVRLEASGGIGLDNVRAVAETGVDRISIGALTHGAPWMDVSLEVT